FRPADGAAAFGMLGWKGPQSQRGDYRHRSEVETRLTDPDAALAILQRAGFAVTLRIDRTVEVYRLGEAMLRLEWYPAMDVLLEVEGAPAAIEQAIRATGLPRDRDRKSTRLNSSHVSISYAVFCLKKKKRPTQQVA